METAEIQRNLQRIDASAKSLFNEIQSFNSLIDDCESQIDQCKYMASIIMDSISEDDDYSYKMSGAQGYLDRAAEYKSMKICYENQLAGTKDELREYISQYDYYKNECENNIQNLNIVVEKLVAVPDSKYSAGVADALKTAEQKLLQNNKFREGCISRINSIRQICGSGGTQPRRVLKR